MSIRTVVAGSVLAAGVGIAGLAGAGAASADAQNWTPGQGGWQPGAGIATFNTNVVTSLANGNRLLNGNGNGNGNGNTFNVLSGNRIGVLNGAFSNNILNSGASSFNTTTIKHSYNTVTVTPPKPHNPS
jgi:hypothetical protein